jgi:hypothetical protein
VRIDNIGGCIGLRSGFDSAPAHMSYSQHEEFFGGQELVEVAPVLSHRNRQCFSIE